LRLTGTSHPDHTNTINLFIRKSVCATAVKFSPFSLFFFLTIYNIYGIFLLRGEKKMIEKLKQIRKNSPIYLQLSKQIPSLTEEEIMRIIADKVGVTWRTLYRWETKDCKGMHKVFEKQLRKVLNIKGKK